VAVASAGPYASLHLAPRQDNHVSTSPLSFLQAGCPSCRPTSSVKALKAQSKQNNREQSKKNSRQLYDFVFNVSLFTQIFLPT